MRLADLSPKWILPDLLTFLCPHCRNAVLSINSADIPHDVQFEAFQKEFGPDWNLLIVPAPQKTPWTFSGKDIETLTVHPSVDASKSGEGHWHGFITNGEIK